MKVIYLLFILITSARNEVPSSALDDIIEDLSILTRVTNAIAIHNMALQGTLEVPTVFAGFLNVNVEVFNNFMTLDSATMTAQMTKLVEQMKNMGKPSLGETELEELVPVIEFLSSELVRDVAALENSRSFNAEEVVTKLFGNQLRSPCDSSLRAQVLSTFTNIFTRVQTATPAFQKQALLQVRGLSDAIIKCVKECEKYDEKSLGEAYKPLVQLETVNSLTNVAVDFNRVFDGLSSSSDTLGKIGEDLRKAAGVGVGGNVGSRLLEASQLTKKLKSSLGTPSTLTAGFPKGLEDLRKVRIDLRTAWFREKVSRGKNIEPLESALDSFMTAAGQSATLGNAWKQLMDGDDEEVKKLAEMVTLVEKINEAAEKVGETAKKTIGDCLKSSNATKVKEDALNTFRMEYVKPAEILLKMRNVLNETASVAGVMKSSEFEKVYNEVITLIPSVPQDIEKVRASILKVKDVDKVINTFERIQSVLSAQVDYNTVTSNISINETNFNLAQPLDNSNLLKFLRCLEGSSIMYAQLIQIPMQMSALLHLKDGKQLQFATSFIEQVHQVQKVVKAMKSMSPSRRRRSVSDDLLSETIDAQGLAMQLGSGMNVLREMAHAHREHSNITRATTYTDDVLKVIREKSKADVTGTFWTNVAAKIDKTINGLGALETYAKAARSKELRLLSGIFKEAEKVPGISSHHEIFAELSEMFPPDSKENIRKVVEDAKFLKTLDLDFVKHQRSLDAAYMSIDGVANFFDDVFGFSDRGVHDSDGLSNLSTSLITAAGVISAFVVFIIFAATMYGFTENGRMFYKNKYLYYFPNLKELEKRRKYSIINDYTDSDNRLILSVAYGNLKKAQECVKKGANIDAYGRTGYTALHIATKKLFIDIIDMLIRNGADRTLLSFENQTAENSKPFDNVPDDTQDRKNIERVYRKHAGKKYRKRVPPGLPMHLFEIYIDPKANEDIAQKFKNEFACIKLDVPFLSSTHCIVPTTPEGVWEVNLDTITWIFFKTIIIKESWMFDSVKDPKLIRQDDKYLVEHLKFNGVVYKGAVTDWLSALSKAELPYLHGVHIFFACEFDGRSNYEDIVQGLGATLFSRVPKKENFKPEYHPYFHANLGPVWIVYDKESKLEMIKDDAYYVRFTPEEFVALLLKRTKNRVTIPDPPTPYIDGLGENHLDVFPEPDDEPTEPAEPVESTETPKPPTSDEKGGTSKPATSDEKGGTPKPVTSGEKGGTPKPAASNEKAGTPKPAASNEKAETPKPAKNK